MKSKSGFGLMEVLAAAVVLGFLIVGLTRLQMGNREAILRVRARDAASFVAQHVLDSIAAIGMKAIEKNISDNCPSSSDLLVYCNPNYKYTFEGKPQSDKATNGIPVTVDYTVEVFRQNGNEQVRTNTTDISLLSPNKTDIISQSLEAVVSWKFKDSRQSISIAKVVR
ncbi:MAG: type II secretion system GspH family protein [Candidatus Fibromonas sp.]|jgi:type II secretory pathway pseudopilin PulG|nr:type II secretion system GspH family protein [Candidatus Fibromonas sp.]